MAGGVRAKCCGCTEAFQASRAGSIPVARLHVPRGVAQSGSAPGWGPGGRRFKSCLPDKQRARVNGPFVRFGRGHARAWGPIWGPMFVREGARLGADAGSRMAGICSEADERFGPQPIASRRTLSGTTLGRTRTPPACLIALRRCVRCGQLFDECVYPLGVTDQPSAFVAERTCGTAVCEDRKQRTKCQRPVANNGRSGRARDRSSCILRWSAASVRSTSATSPSQAWRILTSPLWRAVSDGLHQVTFERALGHLRCTDHKAASCPLRHQSQQTRCSSGPTRRTLNARICSPAAFFSRSASSLPLGARRASSRSRSASRSREASCKRSQLGRDHLVEAPPSSKLAA